MEIIGQTSEPWVIQILTLTTMIGSKLIYAVKEATGMIKIQVRILLYKSTPT